MENETTATTCPNDETLLPPLKLLYKKELPDLALEGIDGVQNWELLNGDGCTQHRPRKDARGQACQRFCRHQARRQGGRIESNCKLLLHQRPWYPTLKSLDVRETYPLSILFCVASVQCHFLFWINGSLSINSPVCLSSCRKGSVLVLSPLGSL